MILHDRIPRHTALVIVLVSMFFASFFSGCDKSIGPPPGKKTDQAQADRLKIDDSYIIRLEFAIKDYEENLKRHNIDADMYRKLLVYRTELISFENGGGRKAEDGTQKEILDKIKKMRPRVEVMTREVYAEDLKRLSREKGHNIEVTATGNNKNVLVYAHGLMSEALVNRLRKESAIFKDAKNIGFKKIIFKSGMGDVWPFDLK
jgi:hypothetical protein